jgi:hypothetical protein
MLHSLIKARFDKMDREEVVTRHQRQNRHSHQNSASRICQDCGEKKVKVSKMKACTMKVLYLHCT